MKHASVLSTAIALLSSSSNAQTTNSSAAAPPTVDLGYVKYRGHTNATAGINYFRGIHYAVNPSGPLRWQKPVPIEITNTYDSNTIYNATRIGPACPQSQPESIYQDPNSASSTAYAPQGQSEDCLLLDVLVPSEPVSTNLPVLVMIHGGGYTEGNAESFPGDAIVNASEGKIIYVGIQYRLGVLGFLAGGEIEKNGVANAGLLDQRAALDWVQRNIRAFGGDPSQVTASASLQGMIWGGSAGGGSVTAQLIAGGAYDTPPFSAAIAEYPWWQPFLNQSEQDAVYYTTLGLTNCTTVTCLRTLSTEEAMALNQQVQNASYPSVGAAYGDFIFGPVVDGRFIQELPNVAFRKGRFYDVPLLVDHDAYEGDIFSNMSQTTQVEEMADAMELFPFAGPAFFSRLYQLYPASDYNSTFFQRQTWFGDFIISCPTYFMATAAIDTNSNRSAVFKLTFAAGSELHGATVPFLTSNITGFPAANNHTLAEIMASYWISFTVNHDPNPLRAADAAFWPSYVSGGNGTVANGESVGFDTLAVTYTTVSAAPDSDANAKCDFFGAHGWQVEN